MGFRWNNQPGLAVVTAPAYFPPCSVSARQPATSVSPRMLESLDPREVQVAGRDCRLFLGQGPLALEVLAAPFPERPRITELRDLFKNRLGGRAAPVLVVGTWGNGRAAVCGPTQHNPIEHLDLALEQVEAVCRRALELRDRHQAIRVLHQLLPQLDAPVPGLRNGGLFAMQELEHGVPERKDWQEVVKRSKDLRRLRGRDLIQALDFVTEEMPGPGLLLLAEDRKTAVAVLLDHPEEIDAASDRFDGVSPVSFALARADREHLDYVMVLAGSTVRIYPARPGVGSGRRGRSETFVELNLDLLPADSAGYLWLLFSAEALRDRGTFVEILERSEDYAAQLGSELRERVYQEVIPRLSRAAVQALSPDEPDQEELTRAYEVALRILYRLLFVAYGEDQDLLPLHTSKAYREHSLKRMAQRLAEAREKGVEFGREDFYWNQVSQIWKAVSRGNPEWDVPAYNGTLFASDQETSRLGAVIEGLSIPDEEFAPALAGLLLDRTPEGVEGPVDFRSLGVREFGTIYEGLLESELSLAETDLTVDPSTDAYLPAGPEDEVEVRAGEVYLHNRSGARKSTGSYYTKSFAVEHLLDRALEPALDEHFQRLSEMTDREAGRRFFEFRVADIAMGSGHFLVAAIDRIERRFVSYLAERPLPDVKQELERLRRAAMDNLGKDWAGDPIEDAQLLRRQVARRCIFGVDLNPMAVELARLSIWIHTFVPGLPLSLLDQNLVQGNSLVGIATFDEASELIQAESGDLFSFVASERLEAVREPLEKLGKLTDLNDAEIREARELYASMREATKVDADLFTILTAARTNLELRQALAQGQVATQPERQGDAFQAGLVRRAEKELKGLDVLHFPLTFPHVFMGEREGFDVLLGNPPWNEATVEEDQFWNARFPGLRSLPDDERVAVVSEHRATYPGLVELLRRDRAEAGALRKVLTSGAFPGMGTGDPDVYKAFAWRYWHLAAPQAGHIGIVLPRSILSTKGSTPWRKAVLRASDVDVVICKNRDEWLFTDVNPGYSLILFSVRKGAVNVPTTRVKGTFEDREAFEQSKGWAALPFETLARMDSSLGLPSVGSASDLELLELLYRHPMFGNSGRLDFRARPATELHATNEKEVFTGGDHPVRNHLNVGHFTFDEDAGLFACADFDRVASYLQEKRERTRNHRRSPFSEMPGTWATDRGTLPLLNPRVVVRDVVHASNPRKVWAAVAPARTILTNTAPYLLFPRGGVEDQAWVLGMLNSSVVDWVGHLKVVLHLNFFILNNLPVPIRGDDARTHRFLTLSASLAVRAKGDFDDWNKLGTADVTDASEAVAEADALASLFFGMDDQHLPLIWPKEGGVRPSLASVRAYRSKWNEK
jgi:hypothetical protein